MAARPVHNLVAVSRFHPDGTWSVSLRGYVDGVYRIESAEGVGDPDGSIRSLLQFFVAKYVRADGPHGN